MFYKHHWASTTAFDIFYIKLHLRITSLQLTWSGSWSAKNDPIRLQESPPNHNSKNQMESAWSIFPRVVILPVIRGSITISITDLTIQREMRWKYTGHLVQLRFAQSHRHQHKNLRKWRHQEAEDGQEAQVDAGHISGILGTFPKALPNPFGPIRTQRSEVFWSSPSKGGACEDSVCGHCSSSWPTPL